MSSTEANQAVSSSSNTTTSNNVQRNKEKRSSRKLKVILRRLPMGMSEPDLIEQLEPLPSSIYRRWFCPADRELFPFAFSRAYFVFQNEHEAIVFCERFNGYVFVDKQGNESMAIAERAPFPYIPNKDAQERDKRMNTIENDSEYIKFLERYNNTTVKRVTDFNVLLKELEEKRRNENLVRPTPLTEFILQRPTPTKYDRRRAGDGRNAVAYNRSPKDGGKFSRTEKSALSANRSSTASGATSSRIAIASSHSGSSKLADRESGTSSTPKSSAENDAIPTKKLVYFKRRVRREKKAEKEGKTDRKKSKSAHKIIG